MKALFVHQNFPGQFLHLAPALAAQGAEVFALTEQSNRARAARLAFGNGFEIPLDVEPMPSIRIWEDHLPERLLAAERRILGNINAVVPPLLGAPYARLGSLFRRIRSLQPSRNSTTTASGPAPKDTIWSQDGTAGKRDVLKVGAGGMAANDTTWRSAA